MEKANLELRQYAKEKKVAWWQVADVLGIHRTTLCVKLRYELPETAAEKVKEAILKVAEKQ